MRSKKKMLSIAAAFAVVLAGGTYAAIGQASAATGPNLLPVSVANQTGRGEAVYLYVIGTNLSTGKLGYVNAGGTFTNWPAGANPPSAAPDVAIGGPGNGGRTTLQVPKNVSGRLYFSLGQKLKFFLTPDGLVQPAPWAGGDANRDILFDWSEFTYNDAGIWLNSSQVDMFAVPHTVSTTGSEGTHSTGTLVANGRTNVINGMKSAGLTGSVYTRSDGTVLRVLAPGKAADTGGLSTTYLDPYITSAWNAYANKTLTVVPFGDQPNLKYFGRTSGAVMKFTNAAGQQVASFNKPSSANVWGCDGALGAPNDQVVGPIARTLCAALNRGTLGTIDTQPSTNAGDFYKSNPTNQYAKLVHQNMADGKAYAFAFDDVGNFESLVHDGAPTSAAITLNPFTGGGGGSAPTTQPTTQAPTQQPTQPPATSTGTSLISNWNGKCIDVPAGNYADGVQVQMWPCNNQVPQKWTATGGTLKTQNNKCLDVAGAGTANGTPIQIANCSGNAAQQWVLSGAGDLVNPQANKCIDIKDWNTADHAKLQLWDCAGTANQKWHKG
ncbi:beta-1,3-glucanase family protein [Actinoplanes sp. TFC3]|uniref:beta-1,3-glucanase family protein n=1 Tax=Actinoplanes sp. TFC3 TaxID=1710355 RepID=UPI000829FED0|nr:beta-1,3-glucanase family protein [Actinoplanes sp. TFC3]